MSPKTIVVAAVNAGKCTQPEILAALKSRISGPAADGLIAGMVRDGLLVLKNKGRIGVTPKGIRLLPSVQAPLPGGVYVPPKPAPRRAGSMDFAALPSVSGSQRLEWRHPT